MSKDKPRREPQKPPGCLNSARRASKMRHQELKRRHRNRIELKDHP